MSPATKTQKSDTTVKTSISLPKDLWKKIQNRKNRSHIISNALFFYLDKEESLKKAEEEYWQKVEESLRGGDGNYSSINPKHEEITDELLEETLWK